MAECMRAKQQQQQQQQQQQPIENAHEDHRLHHPQQPASLLSKLNNFVHFLWGQRLEVTRHLLRVFRESALQIFCGA